MPLAPKYRKASQWLQSLGGCRRRIIATYLFTHRLHFASTAHVPKCTKPPLRLLATPVVAAQHVLTPFYTPFHNNFRICFSRCRKTKLSQGLACDCDAGYSGYDCSAKSCPYGIDPLFVDDANTARMPEWTIEFKDPVDLVSEWLLTKTDVVGGLLPPPFFRVLSSCLGASVWSW